jgi:hypothetical protein
MDIIIRFNTVDLLIVCVEPHNTIYSIKELIEEHGNIPIDSQRLMFKFKFMSNEKTIGDYNITNNSIIYFSNRIYSENILLRERLKEIFIKHFKSINNSVIHLAEQPPNH